MGNIVPFSEKGYSNLKTSKQCRWRLMRSVPQ